MELLNLCREHFLDYLPRVVRRDSSLIRLFLDVHYHNFLDVHYHEDDQRPTISTQSDIQTCRFCLAAYLNRRNADHFGVEIALLEAVEREICTEDQRTFLANVRYCFFMHILPSRNHSNDVLSDSMRREVGLRPTLTAHFRFSVAGFVRHLQRFQSLDRGVEEYILLSVQNHYSQQRREAEMYRMARERAWRAPFRRSPGAERRTRRNGGDRAAETVQAMQEASTYSIDVIEECSTESPETVQAMQEASTYSINVTEKCSTESPETVQAMQEASTYSIDVIEECSTEVVEGSTSRGVKKRLRRQQKEREEREKEREERAERKKTNRKKRKSKLEEKKKGEKAINSTDDDLERETETEAPTLSRSARILSYILMAILLASLLMFLKT